MPHWSNVWSFKRCQIEGSIYHSEDYKRVTARNNCTVCFHDNKELRYGSILKFMKVEGKCQQASCQYLRCNCQQERKYFALLQILAIHRDQLPKMKGMIVIDHIQRVQETDELLPSPSVALKKNAWKCKLREEFLFVIWPIELNVTKLKPTCTSLV